MGGPRINYVYTRIEPKFFLDLTKRVSLTFPIQVLGEDAPAGAGAMKVPMYQLGVAPGRRPLAGMPLDLCLSLLRFPAASEIARV